jgi:hypothetical protein
MKYLKTLNELFKSTYLSASDKIKSRHKSRAEELIKHAAEMGKDTPHERIWHHRFIFPESLENEFYSIQSVEEDGRSHFCLVITNFVSNYGKSRRMEHQFDFYVPKSVKVNEPLYQFCETSKDENFYFRYIPSDGFVHEDSKIARKNALEFYNFFLEYWEDELSEKYDDFILDNFTVNNLYREAYLKTLNELFKSTYKSAADKLGIHHPKRKEELMKHAVEVGTNQPTSKPRLWPF